MLPMKLTKHFTALYQGQRHIENSNTKLILWFKHKTFVNFLWSGAKERRRVIWVKRLWKHNQLFRVQTIFADRVSHIAKIYKVCRKFSGLSKVGTTLSTSWAEPGLLTSNSSRLSSHGMVKASGYFSPAGENCSVDSSLGKNRSSTPCVPLRCPITGWLRRPRCDP